MYTHMIERHDLTEYESAHLSECAECRARFDEIALLVGELMVARHSKPSTDALSCYEQLFTQIQQQAPSSWWQRLQVQLVWDSRRQPALQGVRTASAAGYRLLYSSGLGEIELHIAPDAHGRRIEGDIMAETNAEDLMPALLQLQNASTEIIMCEAESDTQGRFRLPPVPIGRYHLQITPRTGDSIVINELEVT